MPIHVTPREQADYIVNTYRVFHQVQGFLSEAYPFSTGITGCIHRDARSRFPDGTFIQTSRVIGVGEHGAYGKYVDTISGHRYAILSFEDAQAENAWTSFRKYFEYNAAYFDSLKAQIADSSARRMA